MDGVRRRWLRFGFLVFGFKREFRRVERPPKKNPSKATRRKPIKSFDILQGLFCAAVSNRTNWL